MSLLPSFMAAVAVYWVGWIVYARTLHPCAKFPGPFLASFSRLWCMAQVLRRRVDVEDRELHRKYGPIVRVAPNEVIISDPAALKTIYGFNSGFTKTDLYDIFIFPWERRPALFTTRDEAAYPSRRKLVNHIYTMSNVLRSESRIDDCTATLLDQLGRSSNTNPPHHHHHQQQPPIDLSVWIRWYAFDVIGALFFGAQFGFLARRDDRGGWIAAADAMGPLLSVLGAAPGYARPLIKAGSLVAPFVLQGLRAMGDMLAGLVKVAEKVGEEYGMVEVKSEVLTALVVGSDTTSTEIISILYHLLSHPSTYATLRAEIDAATAAGHLGVPRIRYVEAAKLPYLDACCKEGMRLLPSLGMALPREVPAGGRVITGQYFAAGVRVGISATNMHRDKGVFGEDADEFVPERWFREGAGEMEKHLFHFGAGTRSCIGKNIALCEIYKVIPELIRAFDLELADPNKGWTVDCMWLHKVSNVMTKVSPRRRRTGS